MSIVAFVLVLGLVLFNGFFVATEFAIVKVRPSRIEELIRKGTPGAAAVPLMLRRIDGYLSATQFGITLASLGLGWLGKRLFTGPLYIAGVTDAASAEWLSAALAFVMISVLHIVVGELAPKSLALIKPEAVTIAAAWPMRICFYVFFPFIWGLGLLSNGLLRTVGLSLPKEGTVGAHSEEEIRIILTQARSAGLLSGERSSILEKALSMPSKQASHLMIPRNDVDFLDATQSFADNLQRARESAHNRLPLCGHDLDDVIGLIDIRSVLFACKQNDGPHRVDFRDFAKPAVYFPETMNAERLLSEFRTRHIKMAIIVDEYGGTSGIVTPADVVSSVMGEIDMDDDADLVALPGGAYEVDGGTPLDDVEEALHRRLPTAMDMRTVSGFLMEHLGRMPKAGDRINVEGFSFYIVNVCGPRVGRVRIRYDAGGRHVSGAK